MKGLQEEIKKLDTEIELKTEEFLKRVKVFDEIIDLKNQIKQKEITLWYLKKNIDVQDIISDSLKQVFIDSNLKLISLNLTEKSYMDDKNFYLFNVKFNGNINQLLTVIDKIENNKKPIFVRSISIKPMEKGFDIDMGITIITLRR
ncbi:MAG: hypothetical protein K6348_02560 [Deferribacterales bacterium]